MMNHQPEIAIVEANTLTSLGLKTILERMIPMAVIRTFHSFGELTDDTPDMYAHYFISAQIYVEHNAFFLPRKRKTIVLAGDSHQFQLSGVPILNIYQAEEQLVKDILKLHQHAHHDGYPVKDMPPTPPTTGHELSAREIEVLVLITKGLINKEIADKLNIGLTTVITHRKNITEKLGIKSVSGLTIYAVMNGYVDALLAGNALATHDLEGAYLNTALGQNIYTQYSQPNGHYNHIDTINRVKFHGSIPAFVEKEGIDNGIIYSCVKKDVPFVLVGSIRDDGPLPEVYANVYEGQDAMRDCVRKATTVICMATTLHSIATGNMTPSFRVMPDGTIRQVYFYSVDVSEFAVNKLGDRGSLSAKSIVTNVQDFVVNVSKGLGL